MSSLLSVATRRPTLVFALLVLVPSCGGGNSDPVPEAGQGSPGRLVIIGGGLQAGNSPVYQAILDGRDGEGPVCVFPTASAEPRGSLESAVERIDAVGGSGAALGIYLTEENSADAGTAATVETIRSCSGFYFSGGVQTRIVNVFRPSGGDSPAFRALLERFQAGAAVSGSSAGAAIMNDPMIGGGSSLGALAEGIRWDQEEGEGVILEKGLGFLARTLVDQHSLARGRWARLLVAVLGTEAYSFGAGIDENTALVVEGDSARVVGASGVVFFDTREALLEGDGVGASGVVVSLLGAGDAVNLRTGEVHLNGRKAPVSGGEGIADLTSLDLFESWNLLRFFAGSAASPDSVFLFVQDGYRFEFRKEEGFEALAEGGEGVQGIPAGLGVGPLLVSFSGAEEN